MNLSSLSNELDLDATLDRLCGDEALLLEILDLFLDEFCTEQQNLITLVHSGNFVGLASKAHYFKGIAQNLGLINFPPEVMQLEQAAKRNDSGACLQSIESLKRIAATLLALRRGPQAA